MTARRRTRLQLGRAILLSAVLSTAGCSSQPARLELVGDPGTSAAAVVNNVPYGQPVSLGSIMLCVSSPATATIESVELHNPSGPIRVDAFAVRPNPYYHNQLFLGREFAPIVELGFDPRGPQSVSGVCPADVRTAPDSVQSQTMELAVQVSWTSGESAGGTALDITYRIDAGSAAATIPFAIWLCSQTCPDSLTRAAPPS